MVRSPRSHITHHQPGHASARRDGRGPAQRSSVGSTPGSFSTRTGNARKSAAERSDLSPAGGWSCVAGVRVLAVTGWASCPRYCARAPPLRPRCVVRQWSCPGHALLRVESAFADSTRTGARDGDLDDRGHGVDAISTTSADEDPADRPRPNARLRAVSDAITGLRAPDSELHSSPAHDVPENSVPTADDLVRQAAEAFAAELFRLRTTAGLSQQELARGVRYDRTQITHFERCTQAPTQTFARQADQFFGSGQALARLWDTYHTYHTARTANRHQQPQGFRAAVGAQEGPGPDAVAAPDIPHDANEHAYVSPVPEADSRRLPDSPSGIDMRGATHTNVNVQLGNGNTQHVTF